MPSNLPIGYVGGVRLQASNINIPMELAIARGDIPGCRIFNIPGRHEANVETTQLGDVSLIPSVVNIANPGGQQLEVISSAAEDDSGNTGINTLEIHYLDNTFDEQSETVVMNGQTAVTTTATDINRVQWIHAKTVGTNVVAKGNISLREIDDSPVFEYIAAGGNQSLSARYTVPRNHTAYLVSWHCSGLKKRIDFYMRATAERLDRTGTTNVFLFQDFETCEASNSGILPLNYVAVPEKQTIKISAQADGNTGEAGAGFTIILQQNS